MHNKTRALFQTYTDQLSRLNGVESTSTKFSIDPTVEQTLEDRIQDSADFLQSINMISRTEQSGQILGLGASGPVAGRTNTAEKDRKPRAVTGLTKREYTCRKTDFDTFVPYALLDSWAKFPDFHARIRDHVTRQIARDRLMIGWNGTSAAANTNPVKNTLLQDVNIGWLQHLRTDAPARVMSGKKMGEAKGADYRNLDALVFDVCNELVAEHHRGDPSIVVIVGNQLLNDRYLSLINNPTADAPTERAAWQTTILNKTIGGRSALTVPFFPARSVLVTSPSNLSIYWQAGSHRRHIEDEPKRDRIVDYLSINEAYVVEDMGKCALVEGILLPDGQDGWA